MKPNVFSGLNLISTVRDLDEACKVYGFDFPVELRDLSFPDKDGVAKLSPYHKQVVAADNDDALGVVGLRYTVVPYREAFAPVSELSRHGARIVGGGAPNMREEAYLILEWPGTIKLSEGDEIVNRCTMRASHNGNTKIEIRMTPYRARNGTALTFDATRPLAFKHTPKVSNRINQARKIYKRVHDSWNEFAENVARLVTINITDTDAKSLITSVLGEADSTRMENIQAEIYSTFKHGTACQLPRCKGTVFGLVQAFAEWADHGRTLRASKKGEVGASLNAKLVADSAAKKQKAWATALWFAKTKKVVSNAV